MATFAISAVATNSIPVENGERVANELTLIQRAQRGDEEACATLFRLHRRRVYSVCLSMTRDVPEAEDLTQEVFLQAFHKVGSFRGEFGFFVVAVSSCCKHGIDETAPAQVSAHAFA